MAFDGAPRLWPMGSPELTSAPPARSPGGVEPRTGSPALVAFTADRFERPQGLRSVHAVQPSGGAAQVFGLSMHSQRSAAWANERYRYDSILGVARSSGTFGDIGCSVTSLTNILNWSMNGRGDDRITPSDSNNHRNNYAAAMRQTGWRDLSGRGTDLLDTFTPIERSSTAGRALEEELRRSIRAGRPVLVGVRREDGSWRHSMVAAGVDARGRVLVVDPWQNDGSGRAQYWPLEDAMKLYGASRFDMAMEARRTSLR